MSSNERRVLIVGDHDPMDVPGQAIATFIMLGIGVIYSLIAGIFLLISYKLRGLADRIPTEPPSIEFIRKVILYTGNNLKVICENIIEIQYEISKGWASSWKKRNLNFTCFLNFYNYFFKIERT